MWYYLRQGDGYIVDDDNGRIEGFYETREEAAARVNYLNGGLGIGQEQMDKLVAIFIMACSPTIKIQNADNDNSTASPRRTI